MAKVRKIASARSEFAAPDQDPNKADGWAKLRNAKRGNTTKSDCLLM